MRSHGAASYSKKTLGSVRSISCSAKGELQIVVHLPAGSDPFTIVVESSNSNGSTKSNPIAFQRKPFICPPNYIGVPHSGVASLGSPNASAGNTKWWLDTDQDFCVMKTIGCYQVLFEPGSGSSVYAGVEICRNTWSNYRSENRYSGIVKRDKEGSGSAFRGYNVFAFQLCSSQGENYRLISNIQWQTIARNAENIQSNWSGNGVGLGVMARGHTDGNPPKFLDPAPDDDPYWGTGNSAEQGWEQRRTLVLSNGETIQDFGGNLSQWIADSYSELKIEQDIPSSWYEFSNIEVFSSGSSFESVNKLIFAPLGLFNSEMGVGRVFGGRAGGVIRGGNWKSGKNGGAFSANLHYEEEYASRDDIGFRCVFRL